MLRLQTCAFSADGALAQRVSLPELIQRETRFHMTIQVESFGCKLQLDFQSKELRRFLGI